MSSGRILLADDHPLTLECIKQCVEASFEVVGTARNGREMVAEAIRLKPDIIVADISMPELSGIDAVHDLRKQGSRAKIVFLTIHSESAFVKACLNAGALGYVVKLDLWTDLIPAIDAALSGRCFISLHADHH